MLSAAPAAAGARRSLTEGRSGLRRAVVVVAGCSARLSDDHDVAFIQVSGDFGDPAIGDTRAHEVWFQSLVRRQYPDDYKLSLAAAATSA